MKGKAGAQTKYYTDDLKGRFKDEGGFSYTDAWKKVEAQLGCSPATAKNLVKKAEEKGIIKRSELDNKVFLQV